MYRRQVPADRPVDADVPGATRRPAVGGLALLQRTAGNRAVTQLLHGGGPVVQRVPTTAVSWQEITKTDPIPPPPSLAGQNLPTSFTFGHIMDANPLTTDAGGLTGSKPKGKSDWWPYFQKRHDPKAAQGKKIYWVQGHLLNDNVHGPGDPKNLVPLSNTSNTNMETTGERSVKQAVTTQKKVVHYRVEAVWNTEPADRRHAYGLIEEGGSLVWGEQFAPSAIMWSLHEKQEVPVGSGNWVDGPVLAQKELGWYNTFPQPAPPQPTQAPATAHVNVTPVNQPNRHSLIVSGTGFTPKAQVTIAYLDLPGHEDAGGATYTITTDTAATGTFHHELRFGPTRPDTTSPATNVQVAVRDDTQNWQVLGPATPVTRIWT